MASWKGLQTRQHRRCLSGLLGRSWLTLMTMRALSPSCPTRISAPCERLPTTTGPRSHFCLPARPPNIIGWSHRRSLHHLSPSRKGRSSGACLLRSTRLKLPADTGWARSSGNARRPRDHHLEDLLGTWISTTTRANALPPTTSTSQRGPLRVLWRWSLQQQHPAVVLLSPSRITRWTDVCVYSCSHLTCGPLHPADPDAGLG